MIALLRKLQWSPPMLSALCVLMSASLVTLWLVVTSEYRLSVRWAGGEVDLAPAKLGQ
jgi:hypothetical protein